MTVFYLCNIACSAGQSALGKQHARRGGGARSFNLNKALIGTLLFLACGLTAGFSPHPATALWGIGYGLSLCCSMHAGFKALSMGPMALTSIIASFSLVVPFFFGVCVWGETITALKALGLLLLLASILLINAKRERGLSLRWLLYALLTLLTNGICSVIQKAHQMQFPTLYRTEFMFWSMLCVLVILSLSTARTPRPRFRFSLSGLVSGTMNGLANYIVLYLSAAENASTLFPIVSIANIAAAWLAGLVFFHERLRWPQLLGLLIGMLSVLLLKL
ncbi:MAG: EamA family transporter [Oscillospiraceae bacterium]|nr:EamA family transporter [Oscillospiraceae bacterium]